jgi:hypothetical protein
MFLALYKMILTSENSVEILYDDLLSRNELQTVINTIKPGQSQTQQLSSIQYYSKFLLDHFDQIDNVGIGGRVGDNLISSQEAATLADRGTSPFNTNRM